MDVQLAARVAGLSDVDAISLSMANLAAANPANIGVAARTVIIAVLSNTLVRGGMIVSLAAPSLRKVMLPSTGLLLVAGAALRFWWGKFRKTRNSRN